MHKSNPRKKMGICIKLTNIQVVGFGVGDVVSPKHLLFIAEAALAGGPLSG